VEQTEPGPSTFGLLVAATILTWIMSRVTKNDEIAFSVKIKGLISYKHETRIYNKHNSLPITKKTHWVFIIKTDQLILPSEIIYVLVYCENHATLIKTCCGKNAKS
jgi:hypothetical protein